jgi:hypothetical protein
MSSSAKLCPQCSSRACYFDLGAAAFPYKSLYMYKFCTIVMT